MSFPIASKTYASTYNVKLDHKHLKQLAKPHATTHVSLHAELMHRVSESILLPGRLNLQFLSRIIQPLSGESKNSRLLGVAVRVTSIVLWLLSIPIALASAILSFPLRLIDHSYRPAISYIDASKENGAKPKQLSDIDLTAKNPLQIRTHNIGFVLTSMSNVGDLRHPVTRAQEIVEAVTNDPKKPEIIFFQEAFHENATQLLCEGLKKEYPYIIYHAAPQISGFNSGAMIASKYPPENVEFYCLNHNIFPETLSPKGLIKFCLNTPKGLLFFYSAHTQALIGEDRANSRFFQLKQIKEIMDADKAAHPNALQVLCGDLNTSRVNAWGGDNTNPPNQAEARVMKRLNKYFTDPFLKDHDALTGERTKGLPKYLPSDNQRMDNLQLAEPKASWFDGPFYEPGKILSTKMSIDRRKHHRSDPLQVNSRKANAWGTSQWRDQQDAENARFDYILFPKEQDNLDATIEIRRLAAAKGTQSASSDHLPVDAEIIML